MKDLFHGLGFKSCGIFNVSAREAFELCSKGAILVDVREEYFTSFKIFDVPRILCIPKSRFEQEYSKLPRNKYLIFADTVGLRSKESVIFIIDKGYDKIANMAGGMVDWESVGLPVKTNYDERLTGSCMCQLKPREIGKSKGKK